MYMCHLMSLFNDALRFNCKSACVKADKRLNLSSKRIQITPRLRSRLEKQAGGNPETNERSLKEPTCVSKAHGGSHLHFPLQAPSRNTLKRSGNENVNGNAGNTTSYRIATKVPFLVTRDEARRAG